MTMDRALPRPLDWRWLLVPPLALLLFWNFAGLAHTLSLLPRAGTISDPFYWRQVDLADPYAWEWVRWSPPAVWLWYHVMAALPVVMVASVAVLFLLPWQVAVVALLSWPFWEGALGGSVMVFIVVAAWHALNGSRWGIVAYVVLFALIPRPLMLPVLAVLVWHYPFARWALVGALSAVVVGAAGMGQLGDWIGSLRPSITGETANLSPSALIGPWWYPIGLALGGFLTWKGWYGLASLAVSPYLLMSYLLMAVIDLRPSFRTP
jgi:hypothetical protein